MSKQSNYENLRYSEKERKDSEQMPTSNINYHSNSLKKLKKITNEIVITSPSGKQIQKQIQSNRLKKAGEEVITQAKKSDGQKPVHHEIKYKQESKLSKNNKLNQISSSLSNRNGTKTLMYNEQLSRDIKLNMNKRVHTQNFKDQCILRDKYKNPIKYKIAGEEKGINDQSIYKMKQGQFSKIQEDYTKKKGLEYLRQGRSGFVMKKRLKSQPPKNNRVSSFNMKNYEKSQIHKLFGGADTRIRKRSSQKTIKKNLKAQYIEQLKEQECILGKLVFQRVKKHLKQDKQAPNYFKRVHNEDIIDDALVNFLKVRIERAEAMIAK